MGWIWYRFLGELDCKCFIFYNSNPSCSNFLSNFQKKPLHSWASPSHTVYRRLSKVRSDMASTMMGSTSSFSTQSMSTSEPVVSVDWLHANLREPDMKVLDASWYMPDEQRNPLQEYQVRVM